VRTIQSGTLNLPAALKVSAQNYTVQQYGGKIIISDAAGNSTVLYALNSPQAGYDLPPVPPQSSSIGGFDVRFDGDKMADVLSSAKDIRVNSAVYPVTIRVEGAVITLRDKATAGKILNQTISSGQSAQINDASVNVIEIHASEKPTVYELSQNYPNPFNPSTVISYQIPVSGMVTLKVYDAIGSEVVTLVNNIQDAGSYNVTFNANKLNSGVYFYTLRAGEYSATKKLILLK
jgi:hypothetical protein